MADTIEVKVPDIGGAKDVDVIEIMVKPGDAITKDQSLVTLEGDKATMEIPAPFEGVVDTIALKVGDKVSQDSLILTLKIDKPVEKEIKEPAPEKAPEKAVKKPAEKAKPAQEQTTEVLIPDIGGAKEVDVIEIMVKTGSVITKDQSLITLEGDKATMEIPAPFDGTVEKIALKVGDKVSQGTLILIMKTQGTAAIAEEKPKPVEEAPAIAKETKPQAPNQPMTAPTISGDVPSASPGVRRLARELGVSLSDVQGSGRKSRITKEDIQNYVKQAIRQKSSGSNLGLTPMPAIDFSQFGSIETKPLNKIKKLTGVNVHRSWITIPHVTQFDEADITELEAFRKAESSKGENDYKLTILAFVCKAVSKALQVFQQFNTSLDASGENLIYKNYYNIGIAVETPNGLVVPVIKGVDSLSVVDIAKEMARLSTKAREKGLTPADMSGGCFTISSLGGIGGTAFTPIVNSPEVAILGLSRSSIKPVYLEEEFKPRLMLPLSLSYDHRVIDGAEAARFSRYLAESLQDIRRILL